MSGEFASQLSLGGSTEPYLHFTMELMSLRESLIEAEASQPQWQGFLGGGSMAGVFHLNQEGCYQAKVWQSI